MWQKRPLQARTNALSPATASRNVLNGNILLFFILAFMTVSFFVINSARSPDDLTARFTIDDSFYYFETAWQTRLNGFVTFDGINRANGVHFLWFMILLAAAFIAPSKILVLYAAYWIGLVLIMAIYGAIWRIGTLVEDRSRILTVIMASCWTFLLSDRENQLFVGMESTLHMAVLWGCLVSWFHLMRTLDNPERLPAREMAIFTSSLVLLTWTRLDSAIFALFLFAYAIAVVVRRGKASYAQLLKCLLLSVSIAAAGAAIQFGFFYAAAGTLLPISGLVKASGLGPEISAGLWTRYISIIYPISTFHYLPTALQLAFELALFVALLGYAGTRAITATAPLRHLHCFAACLGSATVIYMLALGNHHNPFWRWYVSPVYLFYILTVGCALREAGPYMRGKIKGSPVFASLTSLYVLFFIMVMFLVSYRPTSLYLMRAQLAQLLSQETGESDVLAAFNAGQLAFFSERRTINLDGLVNDYSFFQHVLQKPGSIVPYLRKNNVRYIVDYDLYWAASEISSSTETHSTWAIPNDPFERTFRVRELRR